MRGLWFLAGVVSVAIGAVGIFVPLLPTVPLMLLAAFCFARSSQRAHDWLMNHKTFGPPIHDWNKSGAIRRPAKIAATVAVALGVLISILLQVPLYAFAMQLVVLAGVLFFIWTRPDV